MLGPGPPWGRVGQQFTGFNDQSLSKIATTCLTPTHCCQAASVMAQGCGHSSPAIQSQGPAWSRAVSLCTSGPWHLPSSSAQAWVHTGACPGSRGILRCSHRALPLFFLAPARNVELHDATLLSLTVPGLQQHPRKHSSSPRVSRKASLRFSRSVTGTDTECVHKN